jgi:lipopolysaccharide/colanic/teichoic acid biosynthesis glycosyltransferase
MTDIVGALVGLILSAPLIVLFGMLVYLESPGPVFFGQERIGRQGRRFKMYKIRSMRPDAAAFDHLSQSTQRGDPRLLRVGAIMRRWNIDEVPQFWNVLTGAMSLVGPRPERTYHSEKLKETVPHYNARYNAKPGITGWAQIKGLRGDTDLEERIRADLYYLENWNILLDFQIMALTFRQQRNAY